MVDDRWTEHTFEAVEHEPWRVAYAAEATPRQQVRIAALNQRPGYRIHPRAFVATGAHVVAERLQLGECSMIAAGCLVRGDVSFGDNCTFNAGAITMGKVEVGDDVRIASGAVLVGFNHVFDDTEVPIWWQGTAEQGVVIENDVWIGTNVTVLDGVRIGAHSVIAAGAVVTRDVAPYSVVGGSPARLIRDRRDPLRVTAPDRLSAFDRTVSEQWWAVLERCRHDDGPDGPGYVDAPGCDWGPRAQNDAIEIAAAFGDLPQQATRREWVDRLQAQQDPETGLFTRYANSPAARRDDPLAFDIEHEWGMYGLLSTGYALEVLGSGPLHPVRVIEAATAEQLERRLDGLDMEYLAWAAGSWIDGYATGVYLNRRHHGSNDRAAVLWGWLLTHQHRSSGMWGRHLDPVGEHDFGWLMAVNGFYRLTRGTYAQFAVPVPHPEPAIDTVLAHGRCYGWFVDAHRTACNVLDAIHPLWLLGRQCDYRRAEITAVADAVLTAVIEDWVDGAGFAFDARQGQPGLQGTEMWLAIAYLAADVLGETDGLSWEPRGVHRLAPADRLPVA